MGSYDYVKCFVNYILCCLTHCRVLAVLYSDKTPSLLSSAFEHGWGKCTYRSQRTLLTSECIFDTCPRHHRTLFTAFYVLCCVVARRKRKASSSSRTATMSERISLKYSRAFGVRFRKDKERNLSTQVGCKQ